MRIPLLKPNPPEPREWIHHLDRSYFEHTFSNFGPTVQALQAKLQFALDLANTPVVMCNATLALEVALLALELPEGSEVLVPSFTFAATAHAVLRAGLVPVLVDCTKETYHLDLTSAEMNLTRKTSAMVVVHPLGCVVGYPEVSQYLDFARSHKLKLLYDSAAALGAAYPNQNLEATGDCEIFSLHITKTVGIGEGALVVSGSPEFLDRCRRVSNFGFDDDAEVVYPGTNAKMSDFQAAIGISAIERAPEKLLLRRRNAERLIKGLGPTFLPQCVDLSQHSFPFFPARYTGDMEVLKAKLRMAEVGFRQYYRPLHWHPYFAKSQRSTLPNTEVVGKQVICLPCHEMLTPEMVEEIIEVVR